MTHDEQARRIIDLEDEVRELKADVKILVAIQNQFLGVGKFAALGIKTIVVLSGLGGLTILYKFIQWVNAPLKLH